jgi:hypothetical protein
MTAGLPKLLASLWECLPKGFFILQRILSLWSCDQRVDKMQLILPWG